MFQKLDSVGGLLLTHAAVGVAAFFVARGWVTGDQAASLVDQVQNHWSALLLGAGGVGLGVAGKVKNK